MFCACASLKEATFAPTLVQRLVPSAAQPFCLQQFQSLSVVSKVSDHDGLPVLLVYWPDQKQPMTLKGLQWKINRKEQKKEKVFVCLFFPSV